jgi:hypothetical protein
MSTIRRAILSSQRTFPVSPGFRLSNAARVVSVASPNVRLTSILLKNSLLWRSAWDFGALSARQIPASAPHVAKIGAGSGMSFANFLRFWAVAANRNSSLAPLGRAGAIGRV